MSGNTLPPETGTQNESSDLDGIAGRSSKSGGPAQSAPPCYPNIRGEFAADFIAQAQSEFDVVESGADAKARNFLQSKVRIESWLKDKPLR